MLILLCLSFDWLSIGGCLLCEFLGAVTSVRCLSVCVYAFFVEFHWICPIIGKVDFWKFASSVYPLSLFLIEGKPLELEFSAFEFCIMFFGGYWIYEFIDVECGWISTIQPVGGVIISQSWLRFCLVVPFWLLWFGKKNVHVTISYFISRKYCAGNLQQIALYCNCAWAISRKGTTLERVIHASEW